MTRKFLPELDPTLQPPAPNGDRSWSDHEGGLTVLAKYSAALVVSHKEVPAERLKSVPSPWARLLIFEQALYNKRHPAHRQITGEWRGLLGLIGLAPHLGLTIATRTLDLSGAEGVIGALRTMAPRGDSEALWDRMAILEIDGVPIGGTSSRTLVFTGMRGMSSGLVPFQSNRRLIDPTAHYIARKDRTSLALLVAWLDASISALSENPGLGVLQRFMGNIPGGLAGQANGAGSVSRAELLLRVLRDWQSETQKGSEATGRPATKVVKDLLPSKIGNAFPDAHPAQSVFSLIKQVYPADEIAPENDLQVAGSTKVVHPGLSGSLFRNGQPFTGDLALPRGMSREVKNGRFSLKTDASLVGATLPDLGSFFERKLIPILDVAPSNARALSINGVSYLYPFKSDILRHVSATDLEAWTRIAGERATGIRLRLEVPLNAGLSLVHEQDYDAGDVYDQEQVTSPFVTAWPNFEAESWSHYFYVERLPTTNGLHLTPWTSENDVKTEGFGEDGLRWFKLPRPPRAWIGAFSNFNGILLSRTRQAVQQTNVQWDVSIDFGSTHTRVFRSTTGATGAGAIDEVALTARSVPIVGLDSSKLPYEFFVSPDTVRGLTTEAPSLIWLPLDRTLNRGQGVEWLPADGVVYWAALEEAPSTEGLRGNLKWHRDDEHERAAFHSYVSQLYLMIAAEAAAAGGRVRSLITAFPSVLPRQLRTRHRIEWRELESRFEVKVQSPRSESDALAAYLVGDQAAPISANLIAVDIGGSTSDLTFWRAGRKVSSDSIRLAGDILSRLVSVDKDAREAVTVTLKRPPFSLTKVPWDEQDATKNGMLLNSLLRTISSNSRWASEPTLFADNLYDGPGNRGERVLAHLGYLFATVSFVLGMMVRKSHNAAERQIRYDIRFAGKGSEFIRWLDALETGASSSLPSAFFRAGLGDAASDAEIAIVPPNAKVKQEVGRGLLLPSVGDETVESDRKTFIGEAGFTAGGKRIEWDAPLDFDILRSLDASASAATIDELSTLKSFVEAFKVNAATQKVARALGISDQKLDRELRGRIQTKLFGPQSAFAAANQPGGSGDGNALLEPFFVVEAKTLLEHATGNQNLFSG